MCRNRKSTHADVRIQKNKNNNSVVMFIELEHHEGTIIRVTINRKIFCLLWAKFLRTRRLIPTSVCMSRSHICPGIRVANIVTLSFDSCVNFILCNIFLLILFMAIVCYNHYTYWLNSVIIYNANFLIYILFRITDSNKFRVILCVKVFICVKWTVGQQFQCSPIKGEWITERSCF